jgi:serine protease Do
MNKKLPILILLTAAFVSGILFTTVGANFFGSGEKVASQSSASPVPANIATKAEPLPVAPLEFENVFVNVAERINPMVVQIHSEKVFVQSPNDPFRFFFRPDGNGRPPQLPRSQALGSGVVIREDGYIVTNNHVVADADDLIVTMQDGKEYDAEVVGTDPNSDLAVIRIEATGLSAITIPEKASVRVGQWVLAFGSPLSEDLGNTVTSGIISSVRRTSSRLSGLNLFSSFIQTDAAINPGNSGGPLVDLRGNLVGLNSAIYSQSGGNQGIAFAIPVEVINNVVNQLIESGSVERGFLGVNFAGVSRSLAQAMDVPLGAAQVTTVTDDSPALKADIREGDIITAVNGNKLRDFNELRTIIGNFLPGDEVTLSISRDGKKIERTVTLGNRSKFIADNNSSGQSGNNAGDSASQVEDLGISIVTLTPTMRERLGFKDASVEGVMIESIDEGSVAFREAELRQGDVITRVDRKDIESREDFERIYSSLKPGASFLVEAYHTGQSPPQKFFTALSK